MTQADELIDYDVETLLELDGRSYEEKGYLLEFSAKRVEKSPERPHGIDYALVFRPVGGDPIIKFDNAHAVERTSGQFVRRSPNYYHWHRGEKDKGRRYQFVSCSQLLDDFQAEVEREKKERGIK